MLPHLCYVFKKLAHLEALLGTLPVESAKFTLMIYCCYALRFALKLKPVDLVLVLGEESNSPRLSLDILVFFINCALFSLRSGTFGIDCLV